MTRLDFWIGVWVLAAAILIAGVLAGPTINVGGPEAVRAMQAGGETVLDVRVVGISLPWTTPPLQVRVVK